MATLSSVYAIVMAALGLGFVVFLHELGHFLLAKWNNVKVEKFSIGFGPTLLGFRWGETQYVLAAIPLGGFVKMLGGDDATIEERTRTTDPRAYPNKSVSARMAIISAGVIMNIFLGLACFVFAYGSGMEVVPAKVGSVMPASPAYRAGMRAGDEIVAIDGRRDIKFPTLQLKVALSSHDQVLRFEVQRPGKDATTTMDIKPVREAGYDHPTIGIRPSEGLTVAAFQRPAGMSGSAAYPLDPANSEAFFDILAAAGPDGEPPTPVTSIEDYHRILAANIRRPINHVIDRRPGSASEDAPVREKIKVTLPPAQFVDFGMRMTIEPIAAIRAGSPAEAAGFRQGDRIVKVEGRGDFDPMELPTLCQRAAGRPMTFEVERPGADGAPASRTITVTPDNSDPWIEPLLLGRDLDVPSLGLCYPVSTRVVAVKPDSPAAQAGIKPGDVINGMTLRPARTPPKPGDKAGSTSPASAQTLEFEPGKSSWVVAFGAIQEQGDLEIDLVVNKGSHAVRVQPVPVPGWDYPSRGLIFTQLRVRMPPQSIGPAFRLAYDDTIENILSIYATLRSLFTGRVGMGGLGGVVTISRIAFSLARLGVTYLIYFLGILSINLAVLNFMPIPPLDGGQMVFLIAEKVRGRPLPESAVTAVTYLGLFLVLGVMIFVNFHDIFRKF